MRPPIDRMMCAQAVQPPSGTGAWGCLAGLGIAAGVSTCPTTSTCTPAATSVALPAIYAGAPLVNGPSLGTIPFPHQGHLAMSADVLSCHNWEGGTGIQGVEARDAAEQDGPPTKAVPPHVSPAPSGAALL